MLDKDDDDLPTRHICPRCDTEFHSSDEKPVCPQCGCEITATGRGQLDSAEHFEGGFD